MKRLPIALVLASSLAISGCTLWDTINPFKSGKGIDVDAELVVGDKSTEVTGKKETTNNTAEAITNTYNTVNEEYPWWVIGLLVLGWILPSPASMWKSGLKLIKRR